MDYIPTNLPRYVKINKKQDFANSVIKPGYTLLFSQDGQTLSAKTSDSQFVQVGGGAVGEAYVIVQESDGSLKAQKLSFEGTQASLLSDSQSISGVALFNTGMQEPAYDGKGGETSFYKCASVDTAAGTWTGYRLIKMEDGMYEFDTAVTSLSYTGNTPATGKIYSEDGVIEVAYIPILTGIPEDNMLLYLVGDTFNDLSGNDIGIGNKNNNIGLTEHNGAKCFSFTQFLSNIICSDLQRKSFGWDTNRSYSLKVCINEEPTSDVVYHIVRYEVIAGGSGLIDAIYLSYNAESKKWYLCSYGGPDFSTEVQINYGEWFHVGCTFEIDGSYVTIIQYFNGTRIATQYGARIRGYGDYHYCYLGNTDSEDENKQFYGYLCKFRMYTDILTADEMMALSKEV